MPTIPKPALPLHVASFDPWNSSSTGHQRGESRPGTAWRDSRNRRLNEQLRGVRVPPSPSDTTVPSQPRRSVVDMLRKPGLMKKDNGDGDGAAGREQQQHESRAGHGAIFAGTCIHVNGSTFPLVSDHRLKRIVTDNGGSMSLHLGRRKVTHVVLGTSTAGGLAGGKMEREIRRMRGCGVYFVGVEWVLESLKSGKRLPEARFSNARMASSAQASVYDKHA
ncbi:hypothetical protein C2857_001335 [Epichloe festucae Fl1]|uniref:BRCT domain-containing protein n=1 Tax=Epichloe festucae (strain Fl1) TaxID=877507 RepID=A0A7S9KU91_EPIFF|nr:hypothetical protein C2857_001335 [Epichloe festucae Fl1]